jgi:hypothetical protein
LERLFLLIYAIAQTQIDSSVSSILNSLTPLNTLILGALVLDYNSNAIKFLVFNRLGKCFVDFEWAIHHPEQNYYYAILVLLLQYVMQSM